MHKENVFWTPVRFVAFNVFVALLIFIGFKMRGVTMLNSVVLGVHVSSVLVWYLVTSLVWYFGSATYALSLFRNSAVYDKYLLGIATGTWAIMLIPAWLLLILNMSLYIFVNFNS